MAYQFHYTPTGTGVISGKEVLEQTEDAINDLSGQISGDVQTAIDTANNALNTANTASADAQNAINTANTAYTAATNAQNTANTAQNTASNALTAAQNAQNDVNALGNRVTTAEGNITQNTNAITGLTTRMGTAEGNIGNLQTAVSTAQATANSAQQTATTARQQSYVFRYSSTALVASSTNSNALLDNTDNLKVGDKVIDSSGVLFSITAIDTQNSTFTIGTALIDLAQDSDVVHKSGDETISGNKDFADLLRIYNSVASGSVAELSLVNQKVIRGGQDSGEQAIYFKDRAKSLLSGILTRIDINGNTSIRLQCYNKDSDDSVINNYIGITLKRNGSFVIAPSTNNTAEIGADNYRNANIYSNKINNLEPSSLSLPSGNVSDVIDISSYITDLSGGINEYTASVNGWITITCLGCTGIKFSITNFWANGSYRENPNQISSMIPICKSQKVGIYIYGSSPTIQAARFIPCQGNV